MDKDELGLSVAPSPALSCLGLSLTIKPIFVATCQWPAPLHPVASKGMVNQAFHVPRHVGLFTALLTPLRLPEGSQLRGASRNSGCTPRCCVIPMPWFSKRPPMPWLAGPHCNKPNKLMSQTMLRTHCTARRLDSAADPEIFDPVDVRCCQTHLG